MSVIQWTHIPLSQCLTIWGKSKIKNEMACQTGNRHHHISGEEPNRKLGRYFGRSGKGPKENDPKQNQSFCMRSFHFSELSYCGDSSGTIRSILLVGSRSDSTLDPTRQTHQPQKTFGVSLIV